MLVPFYVFIVINASYIAQKLDKNNTDVALECVIGQYPLGKMVIAFEVLVWTLWTIAFPIF